MPSRVFGVAAGRTIVARMPGTKRVLADRCCGAIIDYQDFFLAQVERRSRSRLRRCIELLVRFRKTASRSALPAGRDGAQIDKDSLTVSIAFRSVPKSV